MLYESPLTSVRSKTLVLSVVMAAAVLSAIAIEFALVPTGIPLAVSTWRQIAWNEFLKWLPWFVAIPIIVGIHQRFPLARGKNGWRVALIHLGLACFFVATVCTLQSHVPSDIYFENTPIGPPPRSPDRIEVFIDQSFQSMGELQSQFDTSIVVSDSSGRRLVARAVVGFLTYIGILGGVIAMSLFVEKQEQEQKAKEYVQQLAELQLQTLRMQLRPHFLFNTLNSIGTLMARDADTARMMLQRLSSLLRASLDDNCNEEVELKTEVTYLRHYLDIEKIRFGDRLTVSIDVPASVESALVPSFLLQPLAENAIKHGLEATGIGCLSIKALQDGDSLLVKVTDTGNGVGEHELVHGIGLGNTSERLRILYGSLADVKMTSGGDNEGCCVELRLPYRNSNVSR